MAWLRVDDGYDSHPKLLELNETQRWRWTRVLLHCARHRTDGHVKVSVLREFGLGRAVTTLLELRLLEHNGDAGYVVHDWKVYAPKDPGAADRMARRRQTLPTSETGRWKETRAAVFARDGGICADCGKDCKTPVDERDIWNADHEPSRVALVAAGESIYDIAFIVTRCHSCHSRKTRRQAS